MPNTPTRLDYQWVNHDCSRGGMVESLRITRRRISNPLPLYLLDMRKRDGRWIVSKFNHGLPASGNFAVQVSYKNECEYGHYMMLFFTPQKVILFDSGDCLHTQYEKPLRRLLDDLHIRKTLHVWRSVGTNKGCHQCSLWTAYGYFIASTRSLSRLWDVLQLPKTMRQSLLHDFHKDVLGGLPYTPHSLPKPLPRRKLHDHTTRRATTLYSPHRSRRRFCEESRSVTRRARKASS